MAMLNNQMVLLFVLNEFLVGVILNLFFSAAKLFLNSRNTASSQWQVQIWRRSFDIPPPALEKARVHGVIMEIAIGDGLLLSGWWFQTFFFPQNMG